MFVLWKNGRSSNRRVDWAGFDRSPFWSAEPRDTAKLLGVSIAHFLWPAVTMGSKNRNWWIILQSVGWKISIYRKSFETIKSINETFRTLQWSYYIRSYLGTWKDLWINQFFLQPTPTTCHAPWVSSSRCHSGSAACRQWDHSWPCPPCEWPWKKSGNRFFSRNVGASIYNNCPAIFSHVLRFVPYNNSTTIWWVFSKRE